MSTSPALCSKCGRLMPTAPYLPGGAPLPKQKQAHNRKDGSDAATSQ